MKSTPHSMQRRTLLQAASLTPVAAATLAPAAVQAQDRRDTLIMANEFGPNMLDIHGLGANRPSYGVAWNCYDRLMTYARKKRPDGIMMYDYSKLEPELAERWKMDADGMGVTFYMRKDAKFHDGTPVTAADVKWSYDRALAMGGFPTFQMKAGSLEDPAQFKVVDTHTFHVKFLRADKLTMPDMAVPVASIYNSTLAKKNATDKDPWAAEWLKTNEAGGGAYKVASWKPGDTLLLNGKMLTGRDAAHKRIQDMLAKGEKLPVDFTNRVIYYVGPVDPVRDEVVGPAGPTTATRMDGFTEMMLAKTGLIAMVGKAERGPVAIEAIRKHRAAYLMAVGGAAYLVSKAIKASRVVAFADLGMEAIYEFDVRDMPVTVAVDAAGTSVHQSGPKEWSQKIAAGIPVRSR